MLSQPPVTFFLHISSSGGTSVCRLAQEQACARVPSCGSNCNLNCRHPWDWRHHCRAPACAPPARACRPPHKPGCAGLRRYAANRNLTFLSSETMLLEGPCPDFAYVTVQHPAARAVLVATARYPGLLRRTLQAPSCATHPERTAEPLRPRQQAAVRRGLAASPILRLSSPRCCATLLRGCRASLSGCLTVPTTGCTSCSRGRTSTTTARLRRSWVSLQSQCSRSLQPCVAEAARAQPQHACMHMHTSSGTAALDNYLIRMLLGPSVFFLPLRAINASHLKAATEGKPQPQPQPQPELELQPQPRPEPEPEP